MVDWDNFMKRVEDKVSDIVSKSETFEGNIDFSRIVGDVIKEVIMENGKLKRKEIGADVERGEKGKLVLYMDDSKRKIRSMKG